MHFHFWNKKLILYKKCSLILQHCKHQLMLGDYILVSSKHIHKFVLAVFNYILTHT
jgi:hypothetical protein